MSRSFTAGPLRPEETPHASRLARLRRLPGNLLSRLRSLLAPVFSPESFRATTSDSRFRSVFENMLEGCQIIGVDWRYLYLNEAAERHAHRPRNELIGKRMMDAYPGIERTPLFDVLRSCMNDRRPARMTNEFVYPNGTTGWFELSILPVPEGIFVLSMDITALKLAERSLRESEEKYRSVFESSMDGLLLTSPDGGIIAVNQAACRLFNRTEEELRRLGRGGIVDSEDRRLGGLLDMRARTGMARGELNLRRSDGSTFPAEVSSVAFKTRTGTRTSMVIRDLSDQKRTLDDLEHSKAALETLARSLQDAREQDRIILARELHDELGQVLTSIKLDLTFLLKSSMALIPASGRERFSHDLEVISRLVDRGVESLRSAIRNLRPEILDTMGLVPALEWMADEFRRKSGIGCTLALGSALPEIPTNHSTTLFRIFQEALTNVTRHSGASAVTASLTFDSEHLVLSIADNGKGFETGILAKTPSHGILGMRERALSLGGKTTVDSSPGAGTRITVSLPLPAARGVHDEELPIHDPSRYRR